MDVCMYASYVLTQHVDEYARLISTIIMPVVDNNTATIYDTFEYR